MSTNRGGGFLGWAVLMMALASCSPTRTPAFAPALSQSRQYYQAGEFQQAIDVNAAVLDKFPAEAAVREDYIKTLEGIHGQAQAAVAAKDYAAAERLFTLLLDNFPKYESLGKSLSFSAPGLKRSIRLCRTTFDERRTAQHLQAGEYDRALGDLRAISAAELEIPAGRRRYPIPWRRSNAARMTPPPPGTSSKPARPTPSWLRHYADASKLGLKLPFSRDSVDEGLKRCRSELTRQGLEHYREGGIGRRHRRLAGPPPFRSGECRDPESRRNRPATAKSDQEEPALRTAMTTPAGDCARCPGKDIAMPGQPPAVADGQSLKTRVGPA